MRKYGIVLYLTVYLAGCGAHGDGNHGTTGNDAAANGRGGGGGAGDSAAPVAGDAAVPPDDALGSGAVDAQPIADPRAPIVALLEKVADWQIAQYGANNPDGWIDGTFYAGLMATYATTQKARFLTRANDWAQANQWTIGGNQNPDYQCAGQTYVELYMIDHVAAHLSPTQKVVDATIASGQAGRTVWWWIDALFMAPSTFARVGAVTSQAKYFDALTARWLDVVSALFDPPSSLFFRDASYLKKTCPNGQKMFWSRGNGWVVAGIVRVLEYLPATHPDRPKLVQLLQTMTTRLAMLQKPDGFWPSCLTDAADYPEPETSGTAAFVYGIAWGVNQGILDGKQYLPIVRAGWHALAGAVDSAGMLGWVQPPGAAPGPSLATDTQPYGVGLFLLAGSEVAKLASLL